MPEEIVSRILHLPGYGVYAWEAEEGTGTLTLWIRQTAPEPYYVCGGCGISVRDVHSWTERRVRDLPWGTWQIWVVVEVHRVRCRRCGVRTERLPFLAGKVHYTARLETAVAQDCEAAPVSRVAAKWGLPPETVSNSGSCSSPTPSSNTRSASRRPPTAFGRSTCAASSWDESPNVTT